MAVKMDIVSCLPPEISEIIFKLLDADDLWSCLLVNKKWRARANSNRLWERHCKVLGRSVCDMPNYGINVKFEFTLCSLASEWKKCRHTIVNWKNKNFKSHDLSCLRRPRFYSSNDIIVIIDDTHSGFGFDLEDDEFPSFRFTLPSLVEFSDDGNVLMNGNHIIIVNNNIGIIYRKIEENYSVQSIIAFTKNKNIEITTCNFSQFLENNTNIDTPCGFSFLSHNKFWVSFRVDDILNHHVIIDIMTNEITEIVPPFDTAVVEIIGMNHRILFESLYVIVIYDTDGRLMLKKDVGKFCCASVNDSVVAIFKSSAIVVFDIQTGFKLQRFLNAFYQPLLFVSPCKNTIFFSKRGVKNDIIYAFDINTGKELWSFKIPILYREYGQKSFIDIYGTLLVICLDGGCYDYHTNILTIYVLNIENGDLMSKASYNNLLFFNKNFLVDNSHSIKLFVL